MINTDLLRKESEFRTKNCVVEKAIAISHDDFLNLKQNPLRDNSLIAENVDLMYCDSDEIYHCLLIYDEEQGDGLLVESEGASYYANKTIMKSYAQNSLKNRYNVHNNFP